MKNNVAVIILAAGKGTRMKSTLPKVLHPLCARPMISYTLELAKNLKINNVTVVLGHKHKLVEKVLPKGVKVAVQKKLLGTADAIKAASRSLRGFKGTVLILYADHPLFQKASIKRLLDYHLKNKLDITLLTATVAKPFSYGRIVRDQLGNISGIIEENEANDYQKNIKEVNLGAVCFNKDKLFSALKSVKANNPKKEYYLTSTIATLYKKGALIESVQLADLHEAMGINSYTDLTRASCYMRRKIQERLMKQGVRILDPDSAFIDWDVRVGKGSVIYPFTVIESGVKIGSNCSIGPFCHLRPGTEIKDKTLIGNFVELSRTQVGKNACIKHFSYFGDADIGNGANIGAGSVIANYDGKLKHRTTIKDNAFIGSNTTLIAPVTIGKAALTGAGSVVTKNTSVPAGAIVVGVPAKTLKRKKRGK